VRRASPGLPKAVREVLNANEKYRQQHGPVASGTSVQGVRACVVGHPIIDY